MFLQRIVNVRAAIIGRATIMNHSHATIASLLAGVCTENYIELLNIITDNWICTKLPHGLNIIWLIVIIYVFICIISTVHYWPAKLLWPWSKDDFSSILSENIHHKHKLFNITIQRFSMIIIVIVVNGAIMFYYLLYMMQQLSN